MSVAAAVAILVLSVSYTSACEHHFHFLLHQNRPKTCAAEPSLHPFFVVVESPSVHLRRCRSAVPGADEQALRQYPLYRRDLPRAVDRRLSFSDFAALVFDGREHHFRPCSPVSPASLLPLSQAQRQRQTPAAQKISVCPDIHLPRWTNGGDIHRLVYRRHWWRRALLLVRCRDRSTAVEDY